MTMNQKEFASSMGRAMSSKPIWMRQYCKPFMGLVLAAVVILTGRQLGAQVATADVLGTVTDATGAVVPGAAIQIENVGTSEKRSTVSGPDGTYTFTVLQAGTYQLTVTANSYKEFSAKNIVLVGGDRARVDAPLQIGSTSQQIEVTAQVSALQTASTNVGTTVEGQAVQDIPLNGRNYINLVTLAAGVNAGSPSALAAGSRLDDRRPTSAISANGQQELENNQLVDGMDNSSRWNATVELRPSVEAMQEVRTDVNTYTAEVGHTAAASVNILTKSGTDSFHGSAFEFFRNDITDARNYFAPASTLPHKPELRQNQFGGSFGGPIIRHKTFIFGDFEEFRRIDATNTVFLNSVPTAFERNNPGNLTDLPGGTNVSATANATSLAYFETYPLPNTTGTTTAAGLPQNNFLYNPPQRQAIYLGDVRVDENINAANLMYARYSDNLTSTYEPAELPNTLDSAYFPTGYTGTGAVSAGTQAAPAPSNTTQLTHNALLGYTHIFSPNLIWENKAGYTFFSLFAVPLNYGKNWNDTAPYLIPGVNECLECSGLGAITVTGTYTTMGDQTQAPADRRENTYELSSALTWTHGPHTVKAGMTLMQRNLEVVQQYYKGLFTFKGTGSTAAVTALTHFFTGYPYTYNRDINLTTPHFRTWEPAEFVQDDWRILHNLTLNLGVRYEVFTPPSEKNGQAGRFDLPTLTMVAGGNEGSQTDFSDINPRVGFAYSPSSTIVVRGGFGFSHYPSDGAQALGLANPPNIDSTGTVTVCTTCNSSDAISVYGIPIPTVQSTATSALFGAISAKPALFKHAYVEQFNLLVQKESFGTVFTAGYVGELGRHMMEQIANIDLPLPAGPSPAGTAAPPLPYATQLPNVNTILYWGDQGASSYNSLQLSAERRLSKGLSANFNYTYAHALDDVNDQNDTELAYGLIPSEISTYDYGNAFLDIRQRLAGNFTYALPFGASGSTEHKLLAGGWQVNGLGFWQTGSPITIDSSYTQGTPARAQINTSSQQTVDRPNRGPGNIYGGGGTTGYLNPAAFVKQPLGTAGNIGRNQFRGPHLRRGDLSLFKTVPVREQLKAEFRVECSNITNTPNFAQPSATISAYSTTADANGNFEATNASNFGNITSTAFSYANRQVQFALRFIF